MVERFPAHFYVCADPNQTITFGEAERSLLHDPIVSSSSYEIYLGQIGDSSRHRPPIYEFMCEMQSGLLATFRARDLGGIPQVYSRVDVSTHPRRHRLAFIVSNFLRLDLYPLTVERVHPTLGLGTFTATVFAEPFLLLGRTKEGKLGTVSRRVIARDESFPEALLADYTIGSGKRMESSHVVDTRGRVIVQYSHEAFDYDDDARDRRVEAVFRGTSRRVSNTFWRSYGTLADKDSWATRRIRGELEALGKKAVDALFDRHRRIFMERHLGETEIIVGS